MAYQVIRQSLRNHDQRSGALTYTSQHLITYSTLEEASNHAKQASRRIHDSVHETIYIVENNIRTVEAWGSSGRL